MAVLVYLAHRPGELVTREELEAAVWAGSVVGYDALTGAMLKLRKAFKDNPRHPQIVETLSKKGYRLVAPVRPPDETPDETGNETASTSLPQIRYWRSRPIAWSAIVFGTLGILFWLGPWDTSDDADHIPTETNSIAVLPFNNLSGDAEREYFADGITDDLITDLSKISGLFVIARDSTYVYKGEPLDLRDIARKLNARYVVHGNVRRVEERVRINVQMVDTTAGHQIWAERYDGKLDNVFELQDEITHKIVSALAVRVSPEEQENLTALRSPSLKAYDYFLQGRHHFYFYANKEENEKARRFYQKAIEIDPDFAMAYAMLAWTHAFDAMNGWTDMREHSLGLAYALAKKAIAVNDVLPVAYFVMGIVYREKGEYTKALVEAEEAIRIDPSYANAHVLLATLFYYTGQPRDGLEVMKRAMRLNPHHPHNYPFHLGQAYFVLGQYNEAIGAFRRGLETYPDSERLHVWLAAAYGQSGQTSEAEWEMAQVLTLDPDFTLARIQLAFPFKSPGALNRFLNGLRKAGAPG